MIIMKLKDYLLADTEWIAISKSYFAGFLGALSVFAIMHWYDASPNKIGTVNITSIVDQFVKKEANKNLPPELMKHDIKTFGNVLDAELKKFSKEFHLILLPSEAVISGGKDYTAIVKQRLANTHREDLPDAE